MQQRGLVLAAVVFFAVLAPVSRRTAHARQLCPVGQCVDVRLTTCTGQLCGPGLPHCACGRRHDLIYGPLPSSRSMVSFVIIEVSA